MPTASSMPSCGSPISAKRSSTVATVNSSGRRTRTSSQSSGVDTRASGSGRIEYADATVRSFAFWLKSTNTLSPRSSFHQRAVASPGARFSTSRARVSAASRTCREVPLRRDPHEDVQAARAGGLRPADESDVVEHLARDVGDIDDLRPVHAGHRVEVDPQLVGVVEVFGAHRVRVEVEASEVDDPGQARGIPDHRLLGRRSARVVQGRGVDEVGVVLGHALLEERLLVDALHEALQHHRPPAGAAQRPRRDREEVPHDIELRQPGLREDDLVGARDTHLVTVDLEDLAGALRRTHLATLARGRMPRPGLDAGDRSRAGAAAQATSERPTWLPTRGPVGGARARARRRRRR